MLAIVKNIENHD